jgi:hypothetical protein
MQVRYNLSNIASAPEMGTLVSSVILKENQEIRKPRNYYAKNKDS